MELAPETVETLFAGLQWWGLVKMRAPDDEDSRQTAAWSRLKGMVKGGG